MINQAFILCAGKATRLYPLTLEKPKCLLNIDNRCVLDIILEWLTLHGLNRFICNAYWKKDLIKNYAQNSKFNLDISEESDILGTCGGILNAIDMMEDNFIVVYGDTVSNVDLTRVISKYYQTNADMLIVSRTSDTPWDCGVIESDSNGKVLSIIEKPQKDSIKSNLVNGGILICKKSIFNQDFFDISTDMIPHLLQNDYNIYHEQITDDEILIDMGTFKNYELARELYDNNQNTT